jgi:hypothetical protein
MQADGLQLFTCLGHMGGPPRPHGDGNGSAAPLLVLRALHRVRLALDEAAATTGRP